MNIALIGYGKMGKAIEEIAVQKGHNIVVKITRENCNNVAKNILSKADVAIEFTNPESAVQNILLCFDANVPVVCGSTGWLSELDFIKKKCEELNGTFLHASNFSVGVNIFFELNKKLAALMSRQKSYDVSMEEIHHTQKKDAPSGTAITLAEEIIAASNEKNKWVNTPANNSDELSIISKRIDPAPGTHKITYSSAIDDIEIIHTAHSRKGFAGGALLAAEYIYNKKGIFSMNDVLNF